MTEGPIFRPVNRHNQVQPRRLSDQSLALVVKRAGSGPVSIPAAWPDTACAAASPPPPPVAGWRIGRSCATPGPVPRTTLDACIEEGTEFTDNAASYVGLEVPVT